MSRRAVFFRLWRAWGSGAEKVPGMQKAPAIRFLLRNFFHRGFSHSFSVLFGVRWSATNLFIKPSERSYADTLPRSHATVVKVWQNT